MITDREFLALFEKAGRLGIDVEVDLETQTANALWLNPKGNPAKCKDQISKFFGDGDEREAIKHVINRAAAEIGKEMP